MIETRPIEIIGGGLAGLSLGVALRREDVQVRVIEAGHYPRHRVCGEFIAGLTASTTERLGLGPILRGSLEHEEVAWYMRNEPVRIQRLPSPALGLSRYTLDARLASAFTNSGGILETGRRATEVSPREGRVIASGRRRGRSVWIGLKIHARGTELTRGLEVHLGNEGYVGLSKIEGGWVNVCGFFKRRPLAAPGPDLIAAYLRATGLVDLADRLGACEVDSDSFCAVAALSTDRRVGPANQISLGDACAMIPPFTGNGMAMAWQSAEVALGPLTAYAKGDLPWAAAVQRVNAGLRKRFRLRLVSADTLHSFFLRPGRQRWLAAFNRARLVPLRPLYALLH